MESRYGARRSAGWRPCATLLFSGGQIISGPRLQRALDALAAMCRPVPCITLASCTEEVASSRTYLEPPRRIKARPTGLRLERSRRAATCSTYPLFSQSCFCLLYSILDAPAVSRSTAGPRNSSRTSGCSGIDYLC